MAGKRFKYIADIFPLPHTGHTMSNFIKNHIFPSSDNFFLNSVKVGQGPGKVQFKYLKLSASRHPFFERETVFFKLDLYCQRSYIIMFPQINLLQPISYSFLPRYETNKKPNTLNVKWSHLISSAQNEQLKEMLVQKKFMLIFYTRFGSFVVFRTLNISTKIRVLKDVKIGVQYIKKHRNNGRSSRMS